jgi:AcrR family transcriptional regulator
MQRKKDEIRDAIMIQAKAEFIEKGYQKASLRSIAANAHITHSNIYHYFKNKNDLFVAILQPVINKIEQAKQLLLDHETDDEHHSLEEHHAYIVYPLRFVINNKNILKLLAFQAKGSSLENYVDGLSDWFTEASYSIVRSMERKNNIEKLDVSDFFIHNVAAVWTNFFIEVLMHDITLEQAVQDGCQMMTFLYSGWGGVIQNQIAK